MTEVARLATELFEGNGSVVWGVAECREVRAATLTPAEHAVVEASWHMARRSSFALGRLAAHRALRRLDDNIDPDVLRSTEGAPIWPAGVRGSISHTDHWGIAAVAKGAGPAVGIDIVVSETVESTLAPYIMGAEECVQCPRYALSDRFAAKEAAIKAFWTGCRKLYALTELVVRSDEPSVMAPDGTAATLRLVSGPRFTLAFCSVDSHA